VKVAAYPHQNIGLSSTFRVLGQTSYIFVASLTSSHLEIVLIFHGAGKGMEVPYYTVDLGRYLCKRILRLRQHLADTGHSYLATYIQWFAASFA